MRNEFGFICVGQAAGNIGTLFEELGYNVIFINSSQEDLDILKNAKHKYHVAGGEGCAKDRDKAKSLLANDLDQIITMVRNKMEQRLVFLIFASGGGTGSGLSPFLLEILAEEFGKDEFDPEKRFAAVTILPNNTEPLQPAMNSYNCCAELEKIDNVGSIFYLDNNTREDKFQINREFVNGLDKILNIPDMHKSSKGNIDKAEIKRAIFETRGSAVFIVKRREVSTAPALIAALKNSIFAPMNNDNSVQYYIFSTTQEIDKNAIITEFGDPLDIFATYNDKDNIVLLSGMLPPYGRLQQIEDRVGAKAKKLENGLSNLYESKLNKELKINNKPKKTVVKKVVEGSDGDTKTVVEEKTSARDLLKRYRR